MSFDYWLGHNLFALGCYLGVAWAVWRLGHPKKGEVKNESLD